MLKIYMDYLMSKAQVQVSTVGIGEHRIYFTDIITSTYVILAYLAFHTIVVNVFSMTVKPWVICFNYKATRLVYL